MAKKLTALLILFFSFLSGHSQNDTIIGQKSGFIFESCSRYINFNTLNEVLKNEGFKEIENSVIGFSLGWTSRFSDKNSYGTGILTLLETDSPNSENENKKAVIRILEIAAEMHWVISKSSKWFIYPFYGFGISASRLRLTEKVSDLTFDQSISNLSIQDKNIKEYFNRNPLLFANIGFGIDRKIEISSIDCYLGLSLGYRVSAKSDWGYAVSPIINYSGIEFKVKMRFEMSNKRVKHTRPNYYKYFN